LSEPNRKQNRAIDDFKDFSVTLVYGNKSIPENDPGFLNLLKRALKQKSPTRIQIGITQGENQVKDL